jgi:DNA-binding NarL/FixJ family response regulator
MSVRIVLVDDHVLVRAGIRSLLEALPEVQVVGEAGDAGACMRLVQEHTPDIVLMDISIGNDNGLDLTEQIVRLNPQIRVLVLSMHVSEEHVLHALRSGAAGYLVKDAATTELEFALQSIMRGDVYLCPRVSRQVVDQYLNRSEDAHNRPGHLTARQLEILKMIADGHGTKEIAYQLGLSGKTVESHRAQLMERLGIHDVPGLVRYAIRTGLVKMDT